MALIKNKRLNVSDFLRNILMLASGTTLAQAISIFTAPVLYRIYEKVDYGTLGVYMAFVGVIGVFSTMQYTQAILLEKHEEEAIDGVWLSRLINLGIALLVGLGVLLGKGQIGQMLNNPEVIPWLLLAPVSIFFAGQNSIFRVWANRVKRYKLLTINALLTAILVPLFSISLGLVVEGPTGLFVGLLISQMVPPIILAISLSKNYKLGISQLRISGATKLARKYMDLPKFSLPSEFINRFSNQLPVFMLSMFAGPAVVGVYNLSVRMLGLPISLVGSAVGEVFRQRATEDFHKQGNCQEIFIKTLRGLFSISIIPFVILIIWAPDLFAFVFGEKWRDAGTFSQILSIFFLFRFFVSPLSFLFILGQKLKEDFYWHIWMLVSTIAGLYIGFKVFNNLRTALWIFSINYAVIYICYLIRSYEFSKAS